MDEILYLEKEFKSKIDQSDNLHKIEQVKSEAFGKNGKIGELFKKITTLQGEDRKSFASNLNKLKDNINDLINSKISFFEQKEINKKLLEDRVDITLPGSDYFIRKFFEVDKIKMRFRPSHFPFTEPSAEVDIGYELKDGKIVIGEGDKWLEILGCGMVHPNVLKNCKVNTSIYQGYAFGIGIDRLAMLKYGINDLRSFFETDVRWLEHYGFDPLDIPANYRGFSR
ncbi:MAG: hypothetical protein EBV85_02580 [Candidatus Fonsibacter lacus]|nr:hypothetical protein [Candidatus Fonsibacter lacus]